MSAASHNRIVPEMLRTIVEASETEGDAMIMLESLILGMMLYYRPRIEHASEYLDVITQRIVERMGEV